VATCSSSRIGSKNAESRHANLFCRSRTLNFKVNLKHYLRGYMPNSGCYVSRPKSELPNAKMLDRQCLFTSSN
jgi:hypothetical protein